MAKSLQEQLNFLHGFSACDVSDALLKLQKTAVGEVARAGHLADIVPYAPSSAFAPMEQPKVIAPASTLKFVDKSASDLPTVPENDPTAIPKEKHWVDETEEGTILVVDQPKHQTCAVIGGIMVSRMKVRGLVGCVVSGRVRDLNEMKKSGIPVWAAGKSTVGQGGESKAYARNLQLTINGVTINPGDVIFCDPLEGVVVIPRNMVDQVIELMPKLVEADDKVKSDVVAGSTVRDAFKKHRG